MALADNHSTVQVRFQMGPTNNTGQYDGWNIDDLQFLGFSSGPAPAIASISQTAVQKNQTVQNVIVTGTNFQTGTQVWLTRSDVPNYAIIADGVAVVPTALGDGNSTRAIFDLNLNAMAHLNAQGQPDGTYATVTPGFWDVKVIEADGQTVTLSKAVQIYGTIYYVAGSSTTNDAFATAVGNDANNGLTPATPKASVQSVLSSYALQPGDAIKIDTGTYNLTSNIVVSANGLANEPIDILTSPYGVTFNRNSGASGSYGWDLTGNYINLRTATDSALASPLASGVAEKWMNVNGAYEGVLVTGNNDTISRVDSSGNVYAAIAVTDASAANDTIQYSIARGSSDTSNGAGIRIEEGLWSPSPTTR